MSAKDCLSHHGQKGTRGFIQKKIFNAIYRFIGDYETQHYPRGKRVSPVELLKYLMEQNSMNTTDLGELLGSGRGQASMILNGKRELSKANIRVLADRFKVSPAAFL